jgi:uncharacterized protein YsxB (DUF464 family)
MTKIRMNWEDLTLVCSGHAGGGEKGHDIICAGISALTYALLNTLRDAEARGRTRLVWKVDEEAGKIRMQAIPCSGYNAEVNAYYRVIMNGYRAMEEHYPENITIGEVWAHGNL